MVSTVSLTALPPTNDIVGSCGYQPFLDGGYRLLVFCPCLCQTGQPSGFPPLMVLNGGIVLLASFFEPCEVALPGAGHKLLRAAGCRRPEGSRIWWWFSYRQRARRELRPGSCLFQ